jgi:hypothetical protein
VESREKGGEGLLENEEELLERLVDANRLCGRSRGFRPHSSSDADSDARENECRHPKV